MLRSVEHYCVMPGWEYYDVAMRWKYYDVAMQDNYRHLAIQKVNNDGYTVLNLAQNADKNSLSRNYDFDTHPDMWDDIEWMYARTDSIFDRIENLF